MTQPPTPQTKFNAKRSAENATRRTGIEHSIAEVEGGWMVVAPQSVAENEPPAAEIDALLARITAASADHFGATPGRVTWGDAGSLGFVTERLKEITEFLRD